MASLTAPSTGEFQKISRNIKFFSRAVQAMTRWSWFQAFTTLALLKNPLTPHSGQSKILMKSANHETKSISDCFKVYVPFSLETTRAYMLLIFGESEVLFFRQPVIDDFLYDNFFQWKVPLQYVNCCYTFNKEPLKLNLTKIILQHVGVSDLKAIDWNLFHKLFFMSSLPCFHPSCCLTLGCRLAPYSCHSRSWSLFLTWGWVGLVQGKVGKCPGNCWRLTMGL